jgi:hypothetical protein
VLYCANPSTRRVQAEMSGGQLACIIRPGQGNRRPDGSVWCVDNGCGPGMDCRTGTGYPGDERYLGMLQDLWAGEGSDPCDPDTSGALFAVAPDVVGDAAATLGRSRHMLGWIRYSGFSAALVGQNGLRLDPGRGWGADGTDGSWLPLEWDDFDVLFLGGSAECAPCGWVRPLEQAREISRCPHCHRKLTEWKLGAVARTLAAEARQRGKRVHMGRVNSLKRLRYAAAIGCDSADGTYLVRTRNPDKYLPVVLGWLRKVNDPNAPAVMFDMIGAA